MKALYKEQNHVRLAELALPELQPDEVCIAVQAAGLCRTDLLVMQARLPAIDPLIPGHELAGELCELGAAVQHLKVGQRVTVHPFIGCQHCSQCQQGHPEYCPQACMLGQYRHGAFAQYLVVPATACFALPPELPWLQGAYCEPVAAALGVFATGIQPGQQGLVTGDNRIAHLTRQLLKIKGFAVNAQPLTEQPASSLDFVIESGLNPTELTEAVRVLKPGGKLILKSRHLQPFDFPWSDWVYKGLQLQGMMYGSFEEALELLASGQLELQTLLGESFGLGDYQAFLEPSPESQKRFLLPWQ